MIVTDELTPRERETLMLRAEGFTTAEAAEKMGIAYETAKMHSTRAFEKLQVNTLIMALRKLGLFKD